MQNVKVLENIKLLEYVNFSIFSIFLLGIFLLSALALLTVLTFINNKEKDFSFMAILSLGMGPALMTWFFTMALWLFPKQEPYLYVWSIVIICSFIAMLRPRYIFNMSKKALYFHLKQYDNFANKIFAITAIVLISLIIFGLLSISIFLPIFGNDPLEYAQAARLIAEARSVDIYPFVDSEKSGGFYAPLTHPLGYISLMTFGYLLQGSTEHAGIIKMINPYFVFASTAIIWYFASQKKLIAGPLAASLFISTPLYFEIAAQFHIDALRIFTFTTSFIALYFHIKRPNFSTAIIVGITVGMSHFTHSIGILTLPILIPIYLITSGLSLKKQILYLGTIIIIGVAFILPRWVVNIITYGSLVADQVKVWSIPSVYFAEHLAAVRQIITPLDKIYFGILKGFSYPKQFGLSYYLFAFALIWLLIKNKPHKNVIKIWKERLFFKPDIIVFSLWVLAGYYAIVVLSAILDMDLIIKNSRYILTVQPFVSVITACVIAEIFTKKSIFQSRNNHIKDIQDLNNKALRNE